jgi:hypothetical protein
MHGVVLLRMSLEGRLMEVVVVGDQCHWAYCTPCFLEVPTVAARCLDVLRDARDPSSERWNFNERERSAENFA